MRKIVALWLLTSGCINPTPGFEERFQKEASLCSSAIRPALVKVTCFITKWDELYILTLFYQTKVCIFLHFTLLQLWA